MECRVFVFFGALCKADQHFINSCLIKYLPHVMKDIDQRLNFERRTECD
ncbi:hypothetical protein NC99_32950 [Sunxiuqinia dokdonensis]|uniref:Uncharacterized protein n=1 Tax=Sunxiuqinia dokdonensis TaxID=1409788 RepID=A0A0L8V5S9_9BACT|nr:hypothetical protein NC99_32950 [Sunxiuqinia dokdonensis]